jgi:acetyl esterase/lipase
VPVLLFVLGLIFAVLTAISHFPPQRFGTLALAGWFVGWLVGELPVHHLILQVALVIWAIAGGGLGAPIGWAGLGLAALSVAGLVQHLRYALRTEELIDDALRVGLGPRAAAARRPTSLLDLALIWPFRPRTVERVRNCTYHGAGRKRLCLDVYRAADPARRQPDAPVFLFVHGGAWVIGNKGQQGRLLAHRLAEAGWVVMSIDYRLSPWATFPDHLIDVKRALAWARQHAAEYGGDPRFIVIGGGSAGAHLASLAALTPNVAEYQRDFVDVDTSVQGCVAFYGVYDFADRDRAFRHGAFRALLLERIVMKRRFADAPEEFDKASPRWRLGEHAPPFMILHGTRDSLAPLLGARRFRDELRKVTAAPVVWAELPGAQHAFEIFPSVRAAAAIAGVEQFCATIHADWRRATADATTCQR